ncbi:MAG: cytochrome c [Cyclonatronaceae bacterium]
MMNPIMHLFTRSSLFFGMFLMLAMLLSACRGQPTERTQIQPQQNMYWQQKFKAFEPNDFFEDRRAMRVPVENTVARGNLKDDEIVEAGIYEDGSYVEQIPIPVTEELLELGKTQYNISCTPCHGDAGYGNGLVIDYGYVPPQSYHDEYMLEMPDGQIYSRMVDKVEERWAIVAYIRAMQISQGATEDEIRSLSVEDGAYSVLDAE